MSYYRNLFQIIRRPNELELTHTDDQSLSASATSHTFTGIDIGEAKNNRYIVVVYRTYRDIGAAINSVTLNGNAMTPITDNLQSGFFRVRAFIIAAPTGDTATIVGTYPNSTAGSSISVFSLVNLKSTTPYDAEFDNSATSLALQNTIDVKRAGASLHVAMTATNNRTFTWTGTAGEVKVYENSSDTSNRAVSIAIAKHKTTSTGLSVIATADNSIGNPWLLSLSFR